MTDFGGKTSIFSHPVYLFLREFSLQDFRGGSYRVVFASTGNCCGIFPEQNTD
ncbi:transposase [Escherichia coli]|nr:transposase [Escherichia coli]OKV94321.1 transposase [Escherichia coli]OKX18658.1 transposase [Escherichia coli]